MLSWQDLPVRKRLPHFAEVPLSLLECAPVPLPVVDARAALGRRRQRGLPGAPQRRAASTSALQRITALGPLDDPARAPADALHARSGENLWPSGLVGHGGRERERVGRQGGAAAGRQREKHPRALRTMTQRKGAVLIWKNRRVLGAAGLPCPQFIFFFFCFPTGTGTRPCTNARAGAH